MLFLTGNLCCVVVKNVQLLSLLDINYLLTYKTYALPSAFMCKKLSYVAQFTVDVILKEKIHMCAVFHSVNCKIK